ncbi:MAG: beta strand repeat-containing protein, partial [Polyangiaceae bacterium]
FALASDGCSGKPLAAGASCTVGVTFGAKSAGSATASLAATAAGLAGTATASLSGTAVTAAALAVTPSTFDFGPVEQGAPTPPTQTFTVKNTGGSATSAAPAIAVSGSGAKDFTLVASTCKTALAAGADCTFGVTFAPTTAAAESATATVSAASVASVTVALTGTGLAPAALGVSPGSGALGSVVQGAGGTDTTFTVTNGGGVDTGSLTAALQGSQAAQFALGTDGCTGQTLAPGKSCTVDVHAAPQVGGPVGSIAASLEVSATPGGAAAATLSATAVAPANLTVAPASQPMGSVVQGTSSADLPIVFTNSGGAASGPLQVTLGGANAVDYGLGTDGCSGKPLAAGAPCTVYVHFSPAAKALGVLTATLAATATPGGTATASLTGTSITPAALGINPASEPFADTVQGSATVDTIFTVTNGGGGASGKLTVSLGGANAGQFALGTDLCTGKVLAGTSGECTVAAHFAPSVGTLGGQAATLTVSGTPGGSSTANLTGTATSPLSIGPSSPTLASGAFQAPGATTTLTVTSGSDAPIGPLTVTPPAQFAVDATKTTCKNATLTKAAPTCTVGVYIDPASATVVGAQSGTLTVSAGGTTSATDALAATALKPATLVIATTAGAALPVSFGTVRVGVPKTISFVVTNTGAVTSGTVKVAISGAAPGTKDFVPANNLCSAGIDPAKSCSFDVTFTPSTTAGESATLGVTTTAGVGQSGPVSGSGGQAVLEFQNLNGAVVTQHAFGGVVVPTAGVVTPPGSVQLDLVNVGTVATTKLNPSTLPTSFTSPSDFCAGQSLGVGAGCRVTLDFQTATVAETDSATFTLGDGTVSAGVALGGTGIGSGVFYMVTPAPGALTINPGGSGSSSYTVENYGTTTGPSLGLGLDGSG